MSVRAELGRAALAEQHVAAVFSIDDSSDPSAELSARSALEACLEGSLGLGELSALPGRRGTSDGHDALPAPTRSQRRSGHSRGFDVHAGVVVSASDRDGRERLLRKLRQAPAQS